jgi:hypothetical protein
MSSQNIIDYTIVAGNNCFNYKEFINNINMYIGDGYKPYGALITNKESDRNNCVEMIQPMIKYGPANTTD